MGSSGATIQLFGPLSFVVGDLDLTPKSAKGKAMFALLATSPDMRRSRRWLEDKLWSDRGPEQARASLRQTLSEARRLLAYCPDVLFVDRSTVALVDVTSDLDGGLGEGVEFLEGIDVRDSEFNDWLCGMRSRFAPQGPEWSADLRPKKLVVECRALGEAPSAQRIVGNVLADQVAAHICEQVSALRRLDMRPGELTERADIDVSCQIVDGDKATVAFFRITTSQSGQILFSRAVEIPGSPVAMIGSDEVAKVTFEAAEAALQHIPAMLSRDNPAARASALAQIALRKVFAFEKSQLEQADRLLDEAHGVHADPRHLAWRALIRTIQDIEMFDGNTSGLRREADDLLTSALGSGSEIPLVLSLSALVKLMLFDDADSAEYLAGTASYASPNSPFSLQALAVTQMMTGDVHQAYTNSRRSHYMSAGSTFRHWWDLYHCLVCIASRHFEEATKVAEDAVRRAPTFRPPLRNLLALYSHFDEVDRAQAIARRLAAIEPGFSIDRFVDDNSYPNRTVRRAGLVEAVAERWMPRAITIRWLWGQRAPHGFDCGKPVPTPPNLHLGNEFTATPSTMRRLSAPTLVPGEHSVSPNADVSGMARTEDLGHFERG